MKQCTVCQQQKENNEFYFNKITSDNLGSVCRKCDSSEKRRRARIKKRKVVEFMGGECVKCGYSKNFTALEFHHTSDNKEFNSSLNNRSLERMIEEAKKCILVCSNCHREIHNPESYVKDCPPSG